MKYTGSIIISFLLILLCSCGSKVDYKLYEINGKAQGTGYKISWYDDKKEDFSRPVDSIFHAVDRSVSIYIDSSVISRINRNDPDVRTDKIFRDIYNIARDVAAKTNGAFDFTVAPLVEAWGFGFKYRQPLDSAEVDSILKHVGYNKTEITGSKFIKKDSLLTIDFNAIAQGYTVDLIAKYLDGRGIDNYLIDVGGEIRAKGRKPDSSGWKVGIEKPTESHDGMRQVWKIIELKNNSLATSGSYRRFYIKNGKKYSHMINPVTGFPVTHNLLSVSVVTEECALADAYATAFMIMGLQKSIEFVKQNKPLKAFFIYADSSGMIDSFNMLD